MTMLILPKSIQNVLVVGPLYNKLDKLEKIERLLPLYDWIVFNDSISFSPDTYHSIKPQIDLMNQLIASGKVIYNAGSVDLSVAVSLDILDPLQSKIESWIRCKPNVVKADFNGSFQVIIVSGGIPSTITNSDQLQSNIGISFTAHSHESYTGGLGYVITNLPLTKKEPQYYRFSAQIGNTIDGQVYALEINRNGIQKTILL